MAIATCISLTMRAQFSQAHLGVTFPGGDFGDVAATGFNLGYKYYKPLSTENLSLVFGVDLNYNGTNSDVSDFAKEELDELIELGLIESYEASFSQFVNIPVTVGINYLYPVNESVKAYGEFAVGVNYSVMTSEEATVKSGNFSSKEEMSFDPSLGFGFGLEAGAFINDKFSIGLRYNLLGSHKYDYKETSIDEQGNKTEDKGSIREALSLNNLSIVVGIKF
jgi:hypothetical protein